MTVTITPTTLPDATRFVTFSQTITANGDSGETIVSVGISNTVVLDSGLTITNGVSSATLSGSYNGGPAFGDDVIYNLGVANQTPIELYDISLVPPNENMYSVKSTSTNLTINYNVVVVYDTNQTETFPISQTVINNYESVRSFVANYYS